MPLHTKIEWTDFTSNPIKFRTPEGKSVWACAKVSAGLTPYLCEKELRALLTSKAISGKRVFIGDMTDIFGEWVSDELLDRLFAVFALRPGVTFQVLTKRSKRMREYVCDAISRVAEAIQPLRTDKRAVYPVPYLSGGKQWWPLSNVWLGVSAENQEAADARIPLLLQTPAAVRFVSAEPLIGPIDFSSPVLQADSDGYIDWCIVGGESGPGARPCDVSWIRSIVEQCQAASVPVFVKQVGAVPRMSGPCSLDEWTNPCTVTAASGGTHIVLWDRKGGDPSEWPADLRVRQFPGEEAFC